jgi:hypothetical protein
LIASLQEISGDIDVHQSIIEQREKDIEQIEGSILEVNEMFKDLSRIVVEQAPLVGKYSNIPFYILLGNLFPKVSRVFFLNLFPVIF